MSQPAPIVRGAALPLTSDARKKRQRIIDSRRLSEAGFDPGAISSRKRKQLVADLKSLARKQNARNQAGIKRLHALRIRQAMPAFADILAIQAVYAMAEAMTKETGIPHEVDHVVPLLGKEVCGLHWEGNLRPIQRTMNRRKGNRLI
jgi:hypothetical protein